MRRTFLAFVLSIVAHPLMAGAFIAISYLTRVERPPRVEQRPVSLRNLTSSQWEKNRGHKPEPIPKGQIVDVAPGNLKRPVESKYLAETDNSVEKQTRAKEQTNKWKKAAPKTEPPAQPVNLASQLDRFVDLNGPRPHFGPLLAPSVAEPTDTPVEQPSTGGAAPNDDLKEEAGEGTYLNTREWKFAAFFNRVKQAVAAKWDPNGRLKAKSPKTQYYAERTTVLGIALRPDGTLADAFVLKPCGIDVLDQEAVAAFERAAPFMNPPSALVENGYIRFQFGFTLTYDSNGNAFMPLMRRL